MKLSITEMSQLLEQELSQEGLSEKDKSDVTLSVMAVVIMLLENGFPLASNLGLVTIRQLLRVLELAKANNDIKDDSTSH